MKIKTPQATTSASAWFIGGGGYYSLARPAMRLRLCTVTIWTRPGILDRAGRRLGEAIPL